MAIYDKTLKRSKDGLYCRYVGKNAEGVKQRFRLGYDLAEAEKRIDVICAMWLQIEARFLPGQMAFWDRKSLAAAKLIAKGKPAKLPKRDYESPEAYALRVQAISKAAGEQIAPSDPANYELGKADARHQLEQSRTQLSTMLDTASATGQLLGEAVKAYQTYVQREFTAPDGSIDPWGKTRLDQITSIKNYISHQGIAKQDFCELDLADLKSSICDQIYGIFRKRPTTLRTNLKTRMTPSSAKNLIKELGNFFDWLDREDDFEWVFPRRFHSIKKTPEKLSPHETYERRLKREKTVIPDEHLKTLYEYAIPSERILMLLGLNCAFGPGEIGQLRTTFIDFEKSVIDGIRFKSGNDTKHQLWATTRDGLKWQLEQRVAVEVPEHRDIVFLTKRGQPLWHYSKKGNSSNGVSNRWDRLVSRVRRDQPDFPKYSFNKLRKTAATRILQLASAEIASMILAHKTISDDELLHHYALLPWEKLFDAQLRFENELASMLMAVPEPWADVPRTYIGVAKQRKILEMSALHTPVSQIATALGISEATVNRHLQAKYGKRKPGRKPKPK